jgi:hypothetical protein
LYLAGRRKRLARDDLDAAIAIPQDAQCRDFDPVFPRSAEITSPAGRMTLAGKGKVNPRARIPHPDTKQMVLLIFADLRFPVKDQAACMIQFSAGASASSVRLWRVPPGTLPNCSGAVNLARSQSRTHRFFWLLNVINSRPRPVGSSVTGYPRLTSDPMP